MNVFVRAAGRVSAAAVRSGLLINARRAWSTSLDFQPIPDPPLNPLFETAQSALEKSCYLNINWKISEDATVSEAVKRMAAHDIGALAVTEAGSDVVSGIISERDYLNKVAFLKRDPKTTKVSEACTSGRANLVTVTKGNPIDRCMEKMLARDIRHLFVRRKEDDEIVGLLSIKDIVKCVHMKDLASEAKLESIFTTQQIANNPY